MHACLQYQLVCVLLHVIIVTEALLFILFPFMLTLAPVIAS